AASALIDAGRLDDACDVAFISLVLFFGQRERPLRAGIDAVGHHEYDRLQGSRRIVAGEDGYRLDGPCAVDAERAQAAARFDQLQAAVRSIRPQARLDRLFVSPQIVAGEALHAQIAGADDLLEQQDTRRTTFGQRDGIRL